MVAEISPWYTASVCGVLALVALGMGAAEILVLTRAVGALGAWATLGAVITTAAVGLWLARRQGVACVSAIHRAIAEGREVGPAVASGALLLLAGVFMVTPGFVTDGLGLLLLFPPLRQHLARQLARRASALPAAHVVATDRDHDPPPPGVIDV